MAEIAATRLNIAEKLVGTGHKYRKEILTMPIIGVGEILNHMSMRYGIRGKETVGSMSSKAQVRPYRTAKDAKNTTETGARDLETFLGDVVEEFDPVTVYDTIYGEALSKNIKDLNIVRAVSLEMAKSVSEYLGDAIFKGKRNSAGETTLDLFNGFDTIIAAEKTAGNISAEKQNYKLLTDVITKVNAGDILLDIYRKLPAVLKKIGAKLYVPESIKEAYEDWCMANLGPILYNTSYEKDYVHGTSKKLELVAFPQMEGCKFCFISTKKNLLVGVDQMSDSEIVKIRECDNPKVVQFFMKMYFGVEFESINPRAIQFYEFKTLI